MYCLRCNMSFLLMKPVMSRYVNAPGHYIAYMQ